MIFTSITMSEKDLPPSVPPVNHQEQVISPDELTNQPASLQGILHKNRGWQKGYKVDLEALSSGGRSGRATKREILPDDKEGAESPP